MPKNEPPTIEQLSLKLDSLFRHVESLDRNVQVLHGRIQPFSNEDLERINGRQVPDIYGRLKPCLETILVKIKKADAHVEAIERDVAAIRSYLETADGEYQLTEDLKQYYKKDGPR